MKTAVKTGTGALTANLNYDAEGRLRQTVVGSTTTNLFYDGTDLLAEYNGSTLARRYVHGPGVDEPLVWYEGTGTTAKNWIYSNHLGSVVALANTTGTSTATYTYGPYGEPNTTAGNMRFRYTGQTLLAPLGLYYYKARIYSPTLGRFLQTDPIGTADDMNLYAYVGNNPVNGIDPLGLSKIVTGLYAGMIGLGDESLGNIDGQGFPLLGALAASAGIVLGADSAADGEPPQAKASRIASKASDLVLVQKGSKDWATSVKQLSDLGKNKQNVRVESATIAKELLQESRGNMNRFKNYTDQKYKKGYEMHNKQNEREKNAGNDLQHIKWKDGKSGGHIYFDKPN